ncbi:hypothetical protein M8J75_008035 [Diaphorina citri]|nr:hypothetical protein M8J75_008035 [Diaphorina citri]
MEINISSVVLLFLICVCLILQNEAAPVGDIEDVNCEERRLNSTDCLRSQIYFYLRRLKPGLREAEVPSIDPLQIDLSNFFTDKDKLLLNVTVSNIQIQGLSTLDISNINLNQEDGKVEIFGKIGLISAETDLSSEGGILDFPLHGRGHLKLNLYDVSTALMIYYSDANKMISVIKFMSQSVNTFLNENSYEIYNDSKSLILGSLDQLFCKILNNALFYHFVRKDQASLYEGR